MEVDASSAGCSARSRGRSGSNDFGSSGLTSAFELLDSEAELFRFRGCYAGIAFGGNFIKRRTVKKSNFLLKTIV